MLKNNAILIFALISVVFGELKMVPAIAKTHMVDLGEDWCNRCTKNVCTSLGCSRKIEERTYYECDKDYQILLTEKSGRSWCLEGFEPKEEEKPLAPTVSLQEQK